MLKNGKDYYNGISDYVAASTNSVKTDKAVKRAYAAMGPIGEIRKYYTPKVAVPGYRYTKNSYYDQEIVIDISGYSMTMISNRPGVVPQEVRLNKTPEGEITNMSFKVAIEHFKAVNGLMNGHYKFRDSVTKAVYSSAAAYFRNVIRPQNLKAIAAYEAAKRLA